ncbi:MAG TPA: DUF6134 family protein [Flavobacteriales bacterium]
MASALFLLAMTVRAQEAGYLIYKGDQEVGSIRVSRSVSAEHVDYRMTSSAAIDVVWKQRVRTAMETRYRKGRIHAVHTTVRVNDALRDSSNMVTGSDAAWCYVHPGSYFQREGDSDWTTARMYYEEPVDQDTIFVESVLQDCPLVRTGPSRYTLTMPNNNRNHYIYRGGVLHEVQVDRSLIDLVFRRM